MLNATAAIVFIVIFVHEPSRHHHWQRIHHFFFKTQPRLHLKRTRTNALVLTFLPPFLRPATQAKWDTAYTLATGDVLFLFCLVVISASYLSIRSRLNATTLELQVPHGRSSRDQNLRLSKTYFT